MTDNELLAAIRTAAFEADGKTKLTCTAAFHIAATSPVILADIGRVCNANDIRITKCQLGCFG
ncbi:MAG: hypothetical protein ABIK09_05745 [Pseudomonadota bacterium]